MKKTIVECTSVGCRLPECVARDVDELVKGLPSGCSYQRKAVNVDISFEPNERADVSILTNNTVDKSNEVVVPEGVNLDQYRRSMVVLWNHNQEKPVARCGWIKLFHNDIRAKTIYPDRGEGDAGNWHEFVDDVWAMTKSGVLKAKSIGFLPLTPKREPTAEELAANPSWEGAGIWDKTLLLEYSLVSVGCNGDALTIAINNKSVNPDNLTALGFTLPAAPIDLPPVATKAACACHQKAVSPLARYKTDATLALVRKLVGEGYTEEKAVALAYALTYAKPIKPKAKAKKPDVNKLLHEAIERIDVEAIVKAAWDAHVNRGRV